MKRMSLRVLSVLFVMLTPLHSAAPGPEPVVKLDPYRVTDIKPIVKLAEHPMIAPRFGAAVVAEGHHLYIIGGSNDVGTRLDDVERVDLQTGRSVLWTRLKVARRHHRAVIASGKIYVLGGTSGASDPSNPLATELSDYYGDDAPIGLQPPPLVIKPAAYDYESTMEVIDLRTGSVSLGPPMPAAKALFGCVAVDGKILVIGGQKRKGDSVYCTNTTEAYDLNTQTWQTGINMPTPRRCTAVLVDGFVMVVGGYQGTRAVTTVEVYNPNDKVWRRLPDLSEPLNPSATVWSGNYLLMFGEQDARTRHLVYDLRSKQLVPYSLSVPDTDFAAALLHEGNIYVVGGASIRQHTANASIQVFAAAAKTVSPSGLLKPDSEPGATTGIN